MNVSPSRQPGTAVTKVGGSSGDPSGWISRDSSCSCPTARGYGAQMIPRITEPRSIRRDKRLAFGRGDHARPLRIVIDSATVSPSEALNILLGFAHHKHVEVVSTGSEAPVTMTIGTYEPKHQFAPVEIRFPGGAVTRTGVYGPDYPRVAREHAQPGQEAEAERAMFVAMAAQENGGDALVTTSESVLRDLPRSIVGASNPMSAEEAVALLGLFLRVREDFVFEMGESWSGSFDRSLFYLVLTRELIPSGWRWFSAVGQHASQTGNDGLLLLAQSALERIERSLRARDRLHEKLQLPPSRDAATEAIFYFDVALLMLGGALDGTARVAHYVSQLPKSARSASWASKSWMKRLAHVNPTLAALMTEKQPHRDARELVAVLRNTIHSEALRSITFKSGGTRDELVVVPADIEREMEDVLARLGGAAAFGVTRGADNRLYIEPGVYIEAALPHVARALNAIMDSTPIEQLAGVSPANLMTEAPDDRVFAPAIRERVLQLGGIG